MTIFASCALATSADLLLDTSAAIALLDEAHVGYAATTETAEGLILGLAGHAMFETYSVLTRLPGEKRLGANTASQLIAHEFPRSVTLSPAKSQEALAALAGAGISGGAVYDGLVGLAARHAGIQLLSRDRRALPTYQALGVDVRLI